MRARQPTTCKAVAALVATAAIAALAAPAASADVTTVGLGGWQVQSTAQATQRPRAISTPGFAHRVVAARQARRRGRARHRGRRARPDRPLPERVLLDQHEAVLRLHERGSVRHDPAVRRAVVVPDRLHRAPGHGRQHRPDRQRRRRRGRRLGQRPRGRHPATRSRATTRGTRSTSAACCATAPTRSRSRSIRTTRTRCSRSTTSTGRRSRPTTTPASSSRSSCTPRARSRSATRTSCRTTPPDLSTAALTLKADVTNHASTAQTGPASPRSSPRTGAARSASARTVTVAAGRDPDRLVRPRRRPAPAHPPPERVVAVRDGRAAALRPARPTLDAARQRARLASRRRSASGRSPRA